MASLFTRVREWLYRPVGNPPRPDELVELTRYPRRIDAENAVRTLERNGITAFLFSADADGWAPHLGAADGNRVMVPFRHLKRAARVLEQLA